MVMFVDDTEILIQSEDRASEQERLRHIVEQPACHVVDVDYLVSHHHDAAHDEQHRAGILRDFETFLVFHGLDVSHRARSRSASLNGQWSMFNDQCSMFNDLHHRATGSSQQQSDDITDRLKDHLYRLVHTLS